MYSFFLWYWQADSRFLIIRCCLLNTAILEPIFFVVLCRTGLVRESFPFAGLFATGAGTTFTTWLGSCGVPPATARTGWGEGRTLGAWSWTTVGWESTMVWPWVGAGCILIIGCYFANGISVGSVWIMMGFAGTLGFVWVLGAAGSNKGLGWIEGFEFIWIFFFGVSPFSVLLLGPMMGLSSFSGSAEEGLLELSPYKERGDIWEVEDKSSSSGTCWVDE